MNILKQIWPKLVGYEYCKCYQINMNINSYVWRQKSKYELLFLDFNKKKLVARPDSTRLTQ